MTCEEFWKRIAAIPLIYERPSTDGRSRICRAQDGTPVSVSNPEEFSEERRVAMVEFFEAMYSPRKRH